MINHTGTGAYGLDSYGKQQWEIFLNGQKSNETMMPEIKSLDIYPTFFKFINNLNCNRVDG